MERLRYLNYGTAAQRIEDEARGRREIRKASAARPQGVRTAAAPHPLYVCSESAMPLQPSQETNSCSFAPLSPILFGAFSGYDSLKEAREGLGDVCDGVGAGENGGMWSMSFLPNCIRLRMLKTTCSDRRNRRIQEGERRET